MDMKWKPAVNGASTRRWFVNSEVECTKTLKDKRGNHRRFASYKAAYAAAQKANAVSQ